MDSQSDSAKIRITDKELDVINDVAFLYTKKEVTDKIFELFNDIRNELKKIVSNSEFEFPEGMDTSMGKITKGENYNLLPFIVLDYPKLFTQESIFAYRVMFWWGNFFSFTLHLRGEALHNHSKQLINNIERLKNKNFYYCLNNNEWEYHYNSDNYQLIDHITTDEIKAYIQKRDFVKISRKLELKDWNDVKKESIQALSDYLMLLK